MDLESLFLNRVPPKIVTTIYELESTFPSEIAKRVDSPFAHVISVLQKLEKEGLVETKMEGRIRVTTLTERGLHLAKLLVELRKVLSDSYEVERKIEIIKQELDSMKNDPKTDPEILIFKLIPLKFSIDMIKKNLKEGYTREINFLEEDIKELITVT
jgi:predicted transcriptional regulator